MSTKIKFMQLLDEKPYREIKKLGKRRGIGVQEMLRAVIVPEWIQREKSLKNWKRKASRSPTATGSAPASNAEKSP